MSAQEISSESTFNLLCSQLHHPNNNQGQLNCNDQTSHDTFNNQRFNQYLREQENYTNKYSNEIMNDGDKKEIKKQRLNAERKKFNSISYFNNSSLIERIKESNLHYVGFENKKGENCCYINVILHFLYYFPSINVFLIKFYINRKNNFNINASPSSDGKELFLFYLGKTLFEYQSILSDFNRRGITILQTTELRNNLQLFSKNFYSLNKVGDPVELLTFLLNEINIKNKLEVHKDFYINLHEEIKCNYLCKNKDINKYDENNFIHQIYVNEILQFIHQRNLHFEQYNHQLFFLCKQNNQNCTKRCKNCQNEGNTLLKLTGDDYPTFFLLNCVWNNERPELKDVIQFLYVLSLEDNLENLFHCENNKKKLTYNLLGMVLYSGALSHYINVMFNIEKNIFVLYNDDKIKELSNIHEVYKEITAEQIKYNHPNAFYYPVLLIYYREIIYNDFKTTQINEYSYSKFKNLEEICKIAKNRHITLTEEQKEKNHLDLIKAQIRYNRTMSEDLRYNPSQRKNHLDMIIEEEINRKSDNNIYIKNNFHINLNTDDNMIVEDEKEKIFEFEGDEEKEESNDIKRINKRYGTDYKKNKKFHFPNIDFFSNII